MNLLLYLRHKFIYMKTYRLLIVLLALFLSLEASSQRWKEAGYHEFRLSAGQVNPIEVFDRDCIYYSGLYDGTDYLGDKWGTPSINLTYTYQAKRWLAFGGGISYAGMWQKSHDYYTDAVISQRRWHLFSVMAKVRFDWFRLNGVKLYSSLGAGIGYDLETEDYKTRKFDNWKYKSVIGSLDVVAVGMSIGGRVFFFGEAGVSTEGVLKAGIGYRFGAKK